MGSDLALILNEEQSIEALQERITERVDQDTIEKRADSDTAAAMLLACKAVENDTDQEKLMEWINTARKGKKYVEAIITPYKKRVDQIKKPLLVFEKKVGGNYDKAIDHGSKLIENYIAQKKLDEEIEKERIKEINRLEDEKLAKEVEKLEAEGKIEEAIELLDDGFLHEVIVETSQDLMPTKTENTSGHERETVSVSVADMEEFFLNCASGVVPEDVVTINYSALSRWVKKEAIKSGQFGLNVSISTKFIVRGT